LYSAVSLNGKIARSDGNVDWLDSIPNPKESDYGYYTFYEGIDSTIMGFNTYQQVIDWGMEFPYKEKKNYVFTRKKGLEDTEFVEFISEDHIDFVRDFKEKEGKDIWLIGGGQLNTLFLNHGLLDEVQIHVMPIIIPDGIELFELTPIEKAMKLMQQKAYASGVLELKYELS